MKYKPVMKHNPIFEILCLLFILFFCSALASMSNGENGGIWCFPIMAIMVGLGRFQDWLKTYRFQSSAKETTEARIVNRRVKPDVKSYTHYVTYQFYTRALEEMFEFEEKVSETVYNSVSIGTLLTVEYAISDPRLARSSLPKVKHDS